jgi:crotonobetainyl-CoA:carnitine CoA-transferase CaiB-like acyl-CoA transferase
VLNDPQNRANDYLTEIHVDGVGRSTTVGNLVRLSETPGSVKGDPPVLGEANTDILSSLGIDQAVIDDIEQHATATRVEWLTELQQIADAAAGLK